MTANTYRVRCSCCHAEVDAADTVEIRPQAWSDCLPHVCPSCAALWRAWERDEALIGDNGEMVYRKGYSPTREEGR